MIEVLMHIAVGKPLRTHIIEVVRGLQFPPSVRYIRIAAFVNRLLQGVELLKGIILQIVAEPCRQVSLLVRPAHGRNGTYLILRLIPVYEFRRCRKIEPAL